MCNSGNLVTEVFFHEMSNVSDNEISIIMLLHLTQSPPSPLHPPPPQEYMCIIVIVMKS